MGDDYRRRKEEGKITVSMSGKVIGIILLTIYLKKPIIHIKVTDKYSYIVYEILSPGLTILHLRAKTI